MLKCMAKILRPDKGSIARRRQDLGAARARRRVPPRALGPGERLPQRRDPRAVARSSSTRASTRSSTSPGIEQFIDTPVKNYSSGMYVRLGFSVAINVDPDILLIDEVLAVGDAEFQRKCSEKIADFRQQGKTIVIVSHSLPSVRALCDEVALLEHGQLRDLGAAGPSHRPLPRRRVRRPGRRRRLRALGLGRGARSSGSRCSTRTARSSRKAHTGDSVTLRIHYTRHRAGARRAVRHRARTTSRGSRSPGPNTRHAGLAADCLDGRGFVDFRVAAAPARSPAATTSPSAIYDLAALHAYDHVERAFRFDVEAGEPLRRSRRGVARRYVGGRSAQSSRCAQARRLTHAAMSRHRVAVVTADVLAPRMAGPAIRAWHMARGLARDHDVELLSTRQCDLRHADFRCAFASRADVQQLGERVDVVVLQGDVLRYAPALGRSNAALVVDLYDPFHLEVLEQTRGLDPARTSRVDRHRGRRRQRAAPARRLLPVREPPATRLLARPARGRRAPERAHLRPQPRSPRAARRRARSASRTSRRSTSRPRCAASCPASVPTTT